MKLICKFATDYMTFDRVLTPKEKEFISDYINGKRFMSKYHAEQKKQKPPKKDKKAGVTGAKIWMI